MRLAMVVVICVVCSGVSSPSTAYGPGACRDLVMQGRFGDAVREWTGVIGSGTLSIDALAAGHAWRGFACVGTGDTGKAMGDFDRAIEMDPKNDTAYLGRGQIHEMKKDYAAGQGGARLHEGHRVEAEQPGALCDASRAVQGDRSASMIRPETSGRPWS